MDTPHAKFVFSYKLMAGVNVTVRGDGYILTAGAAAPEPLDHAGPLRQVHVEVEKVDILSIQQLLGQLLVLLLYTAQILHTDVVGVVLMAAAGLY